MPYVFRRPEKRFPIGRNWPESAPIGPNWPQLARIGPFGAVWCDLAPNATATSRLSRCAGKLLSGTRHAGILLGTPACLGLDEKGLYVSPRPAEPQQHAPTLQTPILPQRDDDHHVSAAANPASKTMAPAVFVALRATVAPCRPVSASPGVAVISAMVVGPIVNVGPVLMGPTDGPPDHRLDEADGEPAARLGLASRDEQRRDCCGDQRDYCSSRRRDTPGPLW